MAKIVIDTTTLEIADNGDWVNVDITTIAQTIAKAVLAEHGIAMPNGFNMATNVRQGVVRLGMTARQPARKPVMEARKPEPVRHIKPEAAPQQQQPDMAAMFQHFMAMMQNGGMAPQAAPNVVPAPIAKVSAKVGRPVGSGLRRKVG